MEQASPYQSPSTNDCNVDAVGVSSERIIITKLKATNVAAGLRRIPAGFYVSIFIGKDHWQTTNNPVCPTSGVAEWNDLIDLPSDLSAEVNIRIYASFELGYTLGQGELLRRFSMPVSELLERSQNSRRTRRTRCHDEPSLAQNTDIGHNHMHHYYKDHQESRLDNAITAFKHVVDRCPSHHPGRSAALSNLAMAKFTSCQARGAHLDLDEPIRLYQEVLDLRPPGHPDHTSTLINLAMALLSRFRGRGCITVADADEAEELLRRSLDICPPHTHKYRAAFLVKAFSLHTRGDEMPSYNLPQAGSGSWRLPYSVNELARLLQECEKRDDPQLLDELIEQHRYSMKFFVTEGQEWVVLQMNFIAALWWRFERQGRMEDLDEAIQHGRAATISYPNNPSILNNFATALSTRFRQRGDGKDLDEAIQHHRTALQLRPEGHPDHSGALHNIATALATRFEQRGDGKDLDEAIQHYRTALQLRPEGHPDCSASLNNLANALSTQFEQQGDGKDLDEAIQHHRTALQLRPEGHPLRSRSLNNLANALSRRSQQLDHSAYLNNLATVLSTRFEQRGDGKDLDEAIQHHRTALQLLPEGHPDHSDSLNNLANALSTGFEQRGDEKDLDEAIQHHRTALQLLPEAHPHHPGSLNNLATVLSTRFEQRGDGKDLDEAIQHHRTALQLLPEGHPDRSDSLNNLANALSTGFEQRGDGKDLDEAIQHHRTALQLVPEGHPHRSSPSTTLPLHCQDEFNIELLPEGHPACSASLNNLANALSTRFEQRGDGKDLDEAIQHHRTALQLLPEGHPDHSVSLNNLANALLRGFEQQGDGKDLDEAIQHYRTALQLRPEGHPAHSTFLNNLATALSRRFQQGGDGKDIDEAIQHHRTALQLRHEDDFSSKVMGKDLDEAIQHHRTALQLRPEGHPDRSHSLNNLATVLSKRFEQRGDGKDLDEAIQHHRTAQQILPEGHPDCLASLNNLAAALSRRFQQGGDGKDIDEAIQHHRTALQLKPEGYPHDPGYLNNLANALSRRFEQQGDGKDLTEAIQHHRTALQILPEGHLFHSTSLNDLANALSTQFQQQGDDDSIIKEALQHAHAAAKQSLSPSNQLRAQLCLAQIHLALWQTKHIKQHLEDGMHHYKLAAQFTSAGPLQCLKSSLTWIRAAEEHLHPSALDAYTQSLHLLDSHVSATTTMSSRHQVRMHFPQHLAVNAASCALRQGNICHAIELLEQGRALHWTQLARFRTTLHEFPSYDIRTAMLASQFHSLSAQLNQPADVLADNNCSIAAIEAKVQHYRALLEEWHKVVEEIRTLEGFSQFLLPPLFNHLQEAACKGPVIVLIASRFSCDAVIVLHTQSPIHIQLQTTWEEMFDLVRKHLQNIHNSYGPDHNVFVETMGRIWKVVMFPVVHELKKKLKKDSRIWWCPTSLFTALPLHTAGEYQQGGSVLSNLFISSYTPSLSALIKARKGLKMTSNVKFVAIGQDSTHSDMLLQPLQYVEAELDDIKRLLPTPPVIFTKLTSSESTRQEALQSLQHHQWFHLSCHGKQVLKDPFKSCFAMHDAPLSLLDIINANISGHEFAFLSACETAMGDLSAADEVIHLAAGLQFMGVKSVIGTLWSVGDKLAYELVLAYYKEFCKNGTMDCTMAAGALHKAVALLAKKNVPLVERAMFVHIGI
ncbi:CHAT domain-containing protein [Melanogaster broomeanus]|nr:CHAT domain-containing protein [Melanogaster broomeanus]